MIKIRELLLVITALLLLFSTIPLGYYYSCQPVSITQYMVGVGSPDKVRYLSNSTDPHIVSTGLRPSSLSVCVETLNITVRNLPGWPFSLEKNGFIEQWLNAGNISFMKAN